MEIITMKLVDLVKPEKNVRIHTEQQLKEFQRSVKMFGQIRPIVVDENNVSSFVYTKAGAYCSRMELCRSQVQEPSIGSLECRSTREYIKPCRKLLHRMEMELNCLIGRYRQFTR